MTTRQELLNWIKTCEENASPDYCMCGDLVDHDAWNAGHVPVSEYSHYVGKALEALKEYDEANAT